jgi:hypothetical protein
VVLDGEEGDESLVDVVHAAVSSTMMHSKMTNRCTISSPTAPPTNSIDLTSVGAA